MTVKRLPAFVERMSTRTLCSILFNLIIDTTDRVCNFFVSWMNQHDSLNGALMTGVFEDNADAQCLQCFGQWTPL